VSDEFVSVTGDGSTPVIIERITHGPDGKPRHSFSWRCSGCGNPFPGYKAVLATAAEELAPRIGKADVFFFDRVSAGAIHLAQSCSALGALVVFEPSGIGNPVQFRQAWAVADVVKYSHERLSDLPEVGVSEGPRLQVETLGEAGLRYRFRPHGGRGQEWVESPAFTVDQLRDSAGAGDWCTAGLIHHLGQYGVAGFLEMGTDDVRDALRFGQGMAAWNCQFEGARGGMYDTDSAAFQRDVLQILDGGQPSLDVIGPSDAVGGPLIAGLCSACGDVKAGETWRRVGG
jgi:fructokinase